MSSGAISSTAAMPPKAADPALQSAPKAGPAADAGPAPAPVQGRFEVNEKQVISRSELEHSIELLNAALQKQNRDIAFSVDQSTGKDVVRVTSSQTGEVIRQLPYEETLQFVRNLEQMVGLIFDQRA